ncbi:hypothetical protein ACWDYJ_24665 [Streptomyces sp. NPDC003042]
MHPRFDRRAVVAWLLAHDKIKAPMGVPVALAGPRGGTRRFRLEDPWLVLADGAEGEDRVSGWSTEADADALAGLAGGEFGASVRRLTAPGAGPLAVLGDVRLVERFRSGSGDLRVTLSWPAGRPAGRRLGGLGGRGVPRGVVRRPGGGLRVQAP